MNGKAEEHNLERTIKELSETFRIQRPKKISVVTHRRPDIDALASAAGLREAILRMSENSQVSIFSQGGIPLKSKLLFEFLNPPLSIDKSYLIDSNWLFFVDVGGIETTGFPTDFWDSLTGTKVLVDHHPSFMPYSYHAKITADATSTSEVVLKLYDVLGLPMDSSIAISLTAGLLSDSSGLRGATGETIRNLCRLLAQGGDIGAAWNLVSRKMARDERIARIKAAQRCFIQKSPELVVVYSEIGSFNSSSASSLVALGADLAIVFAEDENSTKVSLRSSEEFHERTGISLGQMSVDLSSALGGYGGGHRRAAAFTVAKGASQIKESVQQFVIRYLKEKGIAPDGVKA